MDMEIVRAAEVGHEAAARKAAAVLAAGGIIIYPTDTLYGIGADALNPAALERVRRLKARDPKKPLSILVADYAAMDAHGDVSDEARALAERFLPGALTLIIPAKPHLPKDVTHNDAVGMRIPDDPFTRALAAAYPNPVTATSANMAGTTTPETADVMAAHFGANIAYVDLIVDDGPRAGGTPSTVVVFIEGRLHVIREGAISKTELGI
jgi:L-threonylcarbamoyladenylate synthase